MVREPTVAEAKRAALQQAADVLDRQADEITDRWVDHLLATLYRGRTDLGLEDLRQQTPVLVQGVAEALRRGQPQALAAPWTAAASEHARLRLGQQVRLGDLVREYQMLRQEMFQRYARTSAREARRDGSGLGLYVTRQLVEAQGGRIWVESQVGVGSTFSFSPPVARA